MVEVGANEWWEMWQAERNLGMSDRSICRLIKEKRLEGKKAAGKWWIKAVPYDPRLAELGGAASLSFPADPEAPKQPPPPETRAEAPRTTESTTRSQENQSTPSRATHAGPSRETSAGRRDSDQRRDRNDGGRDRRSDEPQRERRDFRNRRDDNDLDLVLEPLESLVEVKRIGAWRKTCELYALLSSERHRDLAKEAAALLVEGYLAFAGRKIDAYLRCRATLCRLLVDLQFEGDSTDLVKPCFEAMGAVQSLIIRFTKSSKKPYNNGDSRPNHDDNDSRTNDSRTNN